MAQAGTYDIAFARNTSVSINFNLKDSAGDPVDLTNYTVTADVVGESNIVPLGRYELSPTKADAVNGVINVAMTAAQTGSFSPTSGTNQPSWDLLIEDASSFVTKILKGIVSVRETQTT